MRSLLVSLTLCGLVAVATAPAQGVQFIAEQVTQSGGHTHREACITGTTCGGLSTTIQAPLKSRS